MSIEILLKSPSAVHKWLSTGESKLFYEWLDGYQQSTIKELRTNKDVIELHRAQGRLEVINRIMGLKQEIENYQRGVRSGQVQKI